MSLLSAALKDVQEPPSKPSAQQQSKKTSEDAKADQSETRENRREQMAESVQEKDQPKDDKASRADTDKASPKKEPARATAEQSGEPVAAQTDASNDSRAQSASSRINNWPRRLGHGPRMNANSSRGPPRGQLKETILRNTSPGRSRWRKKKTGRKPTRPESHQRPRKFIRHGFTARLDRRSTGYYPAGRGHNLPNI